ncbi:anti-sigma regulatory factor [Thermopolyspora flexuosa]|uniref:Anti-sigma regulatory factor (Ser/Thr protein kinase) n=1 Tax=Thermopolyspora flexuosa TaxID=103836 RepID=A0A543J3L5_9ACTN|nr:ATP-binding protein [Thermopolyspora flexuosa]TQM77413.1 anti-sigma regulatory factor (Ser/Thr protein kinase) [Thermopolyspora flexuosa]GGM73472.1 anti-sigma regulatory factor [Thermopolyspora flexuosa]
MATVELTFSALPAHVRTARLIATAVARRAGVSEDLLDEVRLAVGEACSRAVEAHRLHCPDEPIRIELCDDSGRFEVTVIDVAPSENADLAGAAAGPETTTANGHELAGLLPDMSGFGLAVIAGLADDVEVIPSAKGVRVKMSWPAVSGLPSSA